MVYRLEQTNAAAVCVPSGTDKYKGTPPGTGRCAGTPPGTGKYADTLGSVGGLALAEELGDKFSERKTPRGRARRPLP